jgi:thiosulfate/3-mercaptopyruvate sulfurtransferase
MLPPVVDISELGHLEGEVVIADCRWYLDGRSGHAAFLSGHLPGARFVDLGTALAAPPTATAGRHPLPEPAHFAKAMEAVGVSDGCRTLAYDDAGGTIAARLVWMLRALGEEAALLDGGIGAFAGELESGEGKAVVPGRFTVRPFPISLLASADEVAGHRGVLIDARDRSRYLGEGDPIDPRTGHIPGALSAPCRENLDETGRFLAPGELARRFHALGIDSADELVSYCGSGVTACHNLLAIELAGLGKGRLFPGSWSAWASDPARPIETGEVARP